MRTMYDSLNPAALPADAQLVASYIDGQNAPAPGWEGRFPHAVVVRIARLPETNDGQVADVEAGDMTPQNVVNWVQLRRQHGADPSVYMNASTWPAVRQAFQQRNVAEPHYWVAAWDGHPDLPEGAVAHQYADSHMLGHDYDASAVADHWPGVDGGAQPQPAPQPAPGPPISELPTPGHRYSVVHGDTLSGIAQRAYGNAENWPAIWHANPGVQNPDLIFPGELLLIPELSGPLPGFKRYTVQPGDSLWAIAAREYGNGAEWTRIYDANRAEIGGNPNLIHPGQELVIPG